MKGLFKKSKYLNNKLEEKMKKSVSILIIIFNFIFTSCFTIPGYVDKDGNITPPYLKKIKIEALKGNLSIFPFETSKGISNVNITKSAPIKSQQKDCIFLKQGNSIIYNIEGNHSLIFSFRTLDDEANFTITYRNKTTEYTIHNSDISDKLVYCDNY